MDNRAIGIFDSGVGGLSVYLEARKLLPKESFIFCADQAFVPYGEKTKDELIDRVSKIIAFLEGKNVKAVIAACNTASVYVIDDIRKKFSLPIIATVPAVKTLSAISKTRKAAVFSTPATAKSPYLTELIATFAPDMEIFKVGGSKLEELVEKGELDSPSVDAILKDTLVPLVAKGIDAIALACTHYPFLRQQIQKIVGEQVKIVDSGNAVARRLQTVLDQENLLADEKKADQYYTTGEPILFKKVAEKLTGLTMSTVSQINL